MHFIAFLIFNVISKKKKKKFHFCIFQNVITTDKLYIFILGKLMKIRDTHTYDTEPDSSCFRCISGMLD